MNIGDVSKWFDMDGDNTYRVRYPLTEFSRVLDIGAYVGDWSYAIFNRYQCKIEAFEPVSSNWEAASKRLGGLKNVFLYKAAVGPRNDLIRINLSEDGSSFFKDSNRNELVEVKSVLEVLGDMPTALMKLNIEGGEYDLLDTLLSSNKIELITDLQVQFHTCVPEYEKRYESIKKALSGSHYLTYRFPYVWENWKKC